jgi:hypothetical protein
MEEISKLLEKYPLLLVMRDNVKEKIKRDFGIFCFHEGEQQLQHCVRAAPRRIGQIGGKVDAHSGQVRHGSVLPSWEILVQSGQLRKGVPKCDIEGKNQDYPLGLSVWGKERWNEIQAILMQGMDVPEQARN